MKISRSVAIEASPDQVWEVFAHDFDNAGDWMASIPKSYGAEIGRKWDGAHTAGRVCNLTAGPKPIQVSEQFLAYDEAKKTCTIEVVPTQAPFFMPFRKNVIAVELHEDGAGTLMDWNLTSHISLHTYLFYFFFMFGMWMFLGQVQDELKFFVENGAPHPRKVKALKKLAAKALLA